MNQQRRYLAYLLRLWQESSEPPLWRASLQSPQSDELQGFTSVADLIAFLEEETESSLSGSQDSEEEGK